MPDETIKTLAVEIAMSDGSFSQGVKNLKQQLGVIDSEFKSSIAGVKDWGDTLDGLKSNATALGEKINVQKQIVQQYTEQLQKAKDALAANSQKMLDLKSKVESAKTAWEQSKSAVGANSEVTKQLEAEYNKLNKQYESAESLVRKNQSSVNGYTIQLNNAKSALGSMESKLNDVNKEIEQQSDKWLQAGKSMEEAKNKLNDAGEKFTNIGEKLSVGVTAPIAAAGGIILKGAVDAEAAQGKLQAALGQTAEETKKLADIAIDVWKSGFGDSIDEANKAMMSTRQNMKGLSTDELPSVAKGAMTIAEVFDQDVNEVTATAGVTMKNFKISGQEALDVITVGFQRGGDFSGELLDTLREYAPQFVSLGLSADQAMAMLIKGSEAGAFNLDKVGDAMGEFNKRAQDGSKTTAEGFAAIGLDAQQMGSDIAGGGEKAQQAFFATVTALASMKDPLAQNQVGVALFGTQWEDVRKNVITALTDGKAGLENFKGATDAASKAISDNNPGMALTSSLRELQSAVGPALLPLADIIKNDIAPAIKSLADWFANLSPAGQKTALAIAGIAAAAGPATLAVGSLFKTVGTVAEGVGKLSGILGTARKATIAVEAASTAAAGIGTTGGMAGLGASLGAAAIAAAPWLIAGVAVAGTGYAINKAMSKEAVPAVDLFADKMTSTVNPVKTASSQMGIAIDTSVVKISSGTKKAVSAYLELDKQASGSLTNLYVNSTILTGQTVTDMVNKYSNMTTQIKAGMDKHYQQQLADTQVFFNQSKVLSDSEEATVLANLQANNETKKTEIDNYTKRIQEILSNASQNNRNLTLEEQQEINQIQDNMRVNAVKSLSDSEVESKVILERLKEYGTRITAEQASQIIANAENQRLQTVEKANQQYDQTVANIIRMRDETKVITADQAANMIKEAQRQKEDSIKKAEDLKIGVVKQIEGMNSDVIEDINTTDGSIKTGWQKLGEWFTNNPIIRWIKTKTSGKGADADVDENWSGTGFYQGGLTTLHERGYEIYDLPKGTRIFNHDASEDLVKRTAESVARQVLGSTVQSSIGSLLHIDKLVIANDMDIKDLAYKLEFYRSQVAAAKGGA